MCGLGKNSAVARVRPALNASIDHNAASRDAGADIATGLPSIKNGTAIPFDIGIIIYDNRSHPDFSAMRAR
jgi:hypothetical protein